MRLKQASDALNNGIALINSFIGVDNKEIKERAVKADEAWSCWPVRFAEITNNANVNSGESMAVLFP